jgi:peroxiredoxin Q/BCP
MRRDLQILLAASAILWLGRAAAAQSAAKDDDPPTLEIGMRAPAFEAKDAAGTTWKSADHVGKKFIVVYFYPGDFTPGCTVQAKKFQENMNNLQKQGAEVVGVSGDSAETHARFKEIYKLTYTLVADEKGDVARLWGVPVREGATVKATLPDKTKFEFKRASTAARWTFIVGLNGKIVYKNTKVDPLSDSQQVEAFLKGSTAPAPNRPKNDSRTPIQTGTLPVS